MVSEREIEAAARAVATADWRFEIDEFREPKRWTEAVDAYNLTNNNWRFRYDEIARAALEAAARVRAEDNAEPVVGVSLSDLKEWRSEWIEANDPGDDTDCVTPFDKYLYTYPAPQLSGTVEVKLLEWVKHGNDYFADTVVGQYCVGLVHTSFRTVLRCITQGQWADIEVSGDDGLEDARDAAQADYERRILSALTTSKPEQSGPGEALISAVGKYALEKGEGWRIDEGAEIMDAYQTAITAGKPQPSGWQPIETAPADGRVILVYEARSAHPIHLHSADGDWWRKQGVGPSHWMPLPTPPTTGGGDD